MSAQAAEDIEPQARYLKAALADEWMLNADWDGRTAWRHVLMETLLFNSSRAGDRVFDEVEEILAAREPSRRREAMIYLHVLSLGFQGRYRGSDEQSKLASYRAELFQFVFQRSPSLGGSERVLSEQAYGSTLSHLQAKRMPRVNRWVVVFLLAMLTLLGISELLWLWQSWPVRRVIDRPEQQSQVSVTGNSTC